jgi:N-acetylglucosamine-6-phosphate deacetylase
MSVLIHNVKFARAGQRAAPGSLLLEDGRISATGDTTASDAKATTHVDGRGRLLTPGLIDLHTHGLHRFMYENGAEDLHATARILPSLGTTCVLPTVIPTPAAKTLQRLNELAETLPLVEQISIPGLHLEGPFVAMTGAACAPVHGDVGYLKELLAASLGRVAVMSISPDTPHILPVIEHLRAEGVVVFMTHTRASVEQTQAAIAAGARHATHLYDVFPIPDEKEPGVRQVGALEAILADRCVTVDFIADGVHVPPIAIQATLAAKGPEGIAAITDSNIGAGLPAGIYDTPWGYPVRVTPGDAARIADEKHRYCGCLAGSALTMKDAMANLLRWLELPAERVWEMGTANPARIVGLTGKGSLQVGADADLVLWNADLTVAQTWVGGRCVYEQK